MLKIKDTILINKYGQGITDISPILSLFKSFSVEEKRDYLEEIASLILQSKPNNNDIETAIKESQLKATYTPCVLLTKGVENHNLKKIINLPKTELEKVLMLLMSLFRIAYQRRFIEEKNNSGKWWYWDLSDEQKVEMILRNYF
ncbi:DUF5958 family protein [Flavobacterium piscis]|uniref:Uncharacterized protein n=1 Tax=Flavobacterium piscis TaxID=1114874 RepID=A0ABU1Y823_9FLAO|nr:DUF5958 family protein [Flavobacterium piscis]MDR7210375.1 hypothetical protein [Flavobacterium piscis]